MSSTLVVGVGGLMVPALKLQRSATAVPVFDHSVDGRISQDLLSARSHKKIIEFGKIPEARV